MLQAALAATVINIKVLCNVGCHRVDHPTKVAIIIRLLPQHYSLFEFTGTTVLYGGIAIMWIQKFCSAGSSYGVANEQRQERGAR